jgi:hypothetical protein
MKAAMRAVPLCFLGFVASAQADERIGPEILVDSAPADASTPKVASGGVGATVVWGRSVAPPGSATVQSAHIDAAGNVTGPFLVTTLGATTPDVQVANDERTTLAAWINSGGGFGRLEVTRLTPTGEPMDGVPLLVASQRLGIGNPFRGVRLAFDGSFFRLAWARRAGSSDRVYTQRVGADGVPLGRAKRIALHQMTRDLSEVNVACRGNGRCLVTWLKNQGVRIQGVRMQGDQILDSQPITILNNVLEYQLRSNGTDYMALGLRFDFNNCGQSECPLHAVAGRVTGDGVALDVANGIQVDNAPTQGIATVSEVGLTFDGTDYVASFTDERVDPCFYNIYGARVAPDGSVANPDSPGSVVSSGGTALSTAVASTHTSAVVAWRDLRPNACGVFRSPSVYAQRAFAHADTFAGPTVQIGAIGPQTLPEQSVLRLRLAAAALNPATTTFSASNLPPGAILDAMTGAFQWKPNPNEAGFYPAVHFEANDGAQSVGEDVSITVSESGLSLCGVVERLNAPVSGVAVQITGGHVPHRIAYSNASGGFCFFYLIQAQYVLSVGRPSKKEYAATPIRVTVGGSDVAGVHFVVRRIS